SCQLEFLAAGEVTIDGGDIVRRSFLRLVYSLVDCSISTISIVKFVKGEKTGDDFWLVIGGDRNSEYLISAALITGFEKIQNSRIGDVLPPNAKFPCLTAAIR
ncbi:hypothetical protein LINPERPRIM_LOCUS15986, partial [Linum perenne]